MKNKLLIIGLFTCLFGYTQDYVPLLRQNNKWIIEHSIAEMSSTCSCVMEIALLPEQVQLNGMLYYKTQTLSVTNNNPFVNTCGDVIGTLYLREDINAKKVYRYFPDTHQEALLYDFNLNIGDVIPVNGYGYNYGFDAIYQDTFVSNITYETVFGQDNVKVFHLAYDGGGGNVQEQFFKIYEGIGVSEGLCFISHSELYFQLLSYSFLSDESYNDIMKNVKIYPNPFSEALNIETYQDVNDYLLFEPTGKLIVETTAKDEIVQVAKSLKQGVYFMVFKTKNVTSKMIALIKN